MSVSYLLVSILHLYSVGILVLLQHVCKFNYVLVRNDNMVSNLMYLDKNLEAMHEL
jgi:hypothetical protein